MAIEPIKGFYVHDEVTDTDGVAKVSVDAVHEFVEDVSGAVENWLDEHPEATTTVEDGSITKAKINTEFLPEIANAYVTPEMFGAKGDGVTDDTQALQDAIDSNKDITFGNGSYLIHSPLQIFDKYQKNYDMGNASILYDGNDSAIVIKKSKHINIKVQYVVSPNGNCIKLLSNESTGYIQYIDIEFERMEANADDGTCVFIDMQTRWINEINIRGGVFAQGAHGVYISNSSTYIQDHLKFYNCAIEGAKGGYRFETTGTIQDIEFYGCRHIDHDEYVFKFKGQIKKLRYYGSSILNSDWIVNDNATLDNHVYYCASQIGNNALMGNALAINDNKFSIIRYNNPTGAEAEKNTTYITGGIKWAKDNMVVALSGEISVNSEIPSGTVIASNLPATIETNSSLMPNALIVKGDGTTRRIIVNASGQMTTSGAVPTGYYRVTGFYLSTENI